MVERTPAAFGHIDILIYNAAILATIQRRVAHNENLFDPSTLHT